MNLLKVSFLLFSIALHVHTSNTKKNPKPWLYNTRKVNRPSDNFKNYFCYPEGNLPTVRELLDPQDNGQERIVIYLYKNVVSNEIKMYTPSADKQVLIPDIPYEPGDGLDTVTTETIPTILNNNPYRIKIYKNRFEKLEPELIDSLPIGLNLGAIEHVLPNDVNNLTPNNKVPSGFKYTTDVLPYDENGNLVNGPQKGYINLPENVFPNKWTTPEKSLPFSLYGNDNPSRPYSPYSNDNPSLPYSPYGNDNPEVIDQHGWSNNVKYPDKNYQDTQDETNPNTEYELDDLVYSFKANDGSYNLPSDSQSISSEQDLNNLVSERYVTFTVWFKQQIKRFQKIHLPQDIKRIDNNILKLLVLQTLSKNKIYVNANGVITDSKGLIIDAGNLELRPLLLGEKINYQFLQNSRNLISLPKYLPYLEGILVTLVHPPQVLGIIPLGKTYLPQVSYQELVNQISSVNGSNYLISNGNANTASYSSASKKPYTYVVKETYAGADAVPVTSAHSNSNGAPVSSNSYSKVYKEPLSPSYSYSSGYKVPGYREVTYSSSGPHSAVNSNGNANTASYSSASKGPYVVKEIYSGATAVPVTSYAYSSSNGAPVSSNSYSKVYKEPLSPSSSYSIGNKVPGYSEVTYLSSGPYSTVNSNENANAAPYLSAFKGPYAYVVKEPHSSANAVPVISSAYSNGNRAPVSSNSYSKVLAKPLSPSYYSSGNNKPGYGEVTYWSSGPSTVSKETLTANWNSLSNVEPLGERRQLTNAKIKHHYEPPKIKKKGKGLISEKPVDVLKNGTAPEPINANNAESGRRLSLKSVMKTLLYLLSDLPSRRDGTNSTEVVNILNESENHNDRDGPDFRIIGGNAATGSGTPLNNKGRSGYDEYI